MADKRVVGAVSVTADRVICPCGEVIDLKPDPDRLLSSRAAKWFPLRNRQILTGAAWRRRDGFDFLAFHFFLDHGERAFAVSLAGPSTSMLQGQNRRYTMKPINKIQAKR